MIGEKCECCGDEVLILKRVEGRNLCLDCYCEYKNKKMTIPKKNLSNENKYASPGLYPNQKGDRRCPNCGRIIPFDSIICPYCGRKFESFL